MAKAKTRLLSAPMPSQFIHPAADNDTPPAVPPDLAARILAELNINLETQEAQPFVQWIIEKLWEEEVATWRQWSRPVKEGQAPSPITLRLETLKRLGGVAGILETHLLAVMEGLTVGEREMAARIFQHLAGLSGDRSLYSSAILAKYTGSPVADLIPLLQKLCSADCQILREFTPSGHRSGHPGYEIFHPILAKGILNWRSNYLDQQQQVAREQRRQQEAAAQPQQPSRRIWQSRLARLRMAELVFLPPLVMALVIFAWQQRTTALHTQAAAQANRTEIAAYRVYAGSPGMLDAYLLDHPQESVPSAGSSSITRVSRTDDAIHALFAGSPGMLDTYLLDHPQDSLSSAGSSSAPKVGEANIDVHALFAGSPGMLDDYLLNHP
ncbi:MAG: hypothetical protein EXR62_03980 [Chloroflexi bacterium]|nr:hypothetical protein [Chloroflexota bacterium]